MNLTTAFGDTEVRSVCVWLAGNTMLRLMLFVAILAVVVGCGSRDYTYKTAEEARAANVFGDSLPDVLPGSSRNILVTRRWNSTGESGTFCFDPHERSTFFSRLSDSIDAKVWGDKFSKTIPALRVEGIRPLAFDSRNGHWVFFCADSKGCTICTWLKR